MNVAQIMTFDARLDHEEIAGAEAAMMEQPPSSGTPNDVRLFPVAPKSSSTNNTTSSTSSSSIRIQQNHSDDFHQDALLAEYRDFRMHQRVKGCSSVPTKPSSQMHMPTQTQMSLYDLSTFGSSARETSMRGNNYNHNAMSHTTTSDWKRLLPRLDQDSLLIPSSAATTDNGPRRRRVRFDESVWNMDLSLPPADADDEYAEEEEDFGVVADAAAAEDGIFELDL